MSEYKQQDDFGTKFEYQDVGFIAVEEKCLQPLPAVKSEPEEVKEDFGEVKPKCDFGIKVEDEETEPHYQITSFAEDKVQVLYDTIKNENSENNYDNIVSKEDQKLISRVYDRSRTLSAHGYHVNVETDRNCDVRVTGYSASCNTQIQRDTLPYVCEVCGKAFNHRSSLHRHSHHIGNSLFSCEVCGKSFNQRCNLKTHLLIHTGDRPFSCEVCGKSFNKKDHLKNHLLIHTGDRAFSCEVCGNTFNRKNQLTAHLRIHTDSRPFSCEVCGKSFKRIGNLKIHVPIHTGDRPFSCEVCGKSFNQRCTLKTHLLIHTDSPQFPCEVCGKSFNRKGNLTRHLRIHTDSPFS